MEHAADRIDLRGRPEQSVSRIVEPYEWRIRSGRDDLLLAMAHSYRVGLVRKRIDAQACRRIVDAEVFGDVVTRSVLADWIDGDTVPAAVHSEGHGAALAESLRPAQERD
jgi:hypothetical protein